MLKDKEKALNLLKQKINGEIKITYREISRQTGYQERQLIRLSQQIEKKIFKNNKIYNIRHIEVIE